MFNSVIYNLKIAYDVNSCHRRFLIFTDLFFIKNIHNNVYIMYSKIFKFTLKFANKNAVSDYTTLNKGMGEIFHFKQRGMFVM